MSFLNIDSSDSTVVRYVFSTDTVDFEKTYVKPNAASFGDGKVIYRSPESSFFHFTIDATETNFMQVLKMDETTGSITAQNEIQESAPIDAQTSWMHYDELSQWLVLG